jgi:hypothetical protein
MFVGSWKITLLLKCQPSVYAATNIQLLAFIYIVTCLPSYSFHFLYIWLDTLSTKLIFNDHDIIYIRFVVDGCRRYQVMFWLLFYFHSLCMFVSEQQFAFCSLPSVYLFSFQLSTICYSSFYSTTSKVSVLCHRIRFHTELFSEDLNGT